jgi:hypothetical protein
MSSDDRCAGCQRRPGDPQPKTPKKSSPPATILRLEPRWPVPNSVLCQYCQIAFAKHAARSVVWRQPSPDDPPTVFREF